MGRHRSIRGATGEETAAYNFIQLKGATMTTDEYFELLEEQHDHDVILHMSQVDADEGAVIICEMR